MKKLKKLLSVLLACTMMSGACIYLADNNKLSSYVITAGAAESYAEQCEQMLNLINQYRASEGVKPLKLYITACDAATVRSNEITSLFSHDRPNGTDCFTLLDEFKITCGFAGENIAMGYPDVVSVMEAWMGSDGHRANMLSSRYEYIGIGIYTADDYWHTKYWTQFFVGSIPPSQSKGDVNGDEVINAIDASSTLQYYAYQATAPLFTQTDAFIVAADVDNNGVVNAVDASKILKYYSDTATGKTPSFN